MLKAEPWIREIELKDWTFFVTVAFVFVAVTKAHDTQQLSEDRLDKLLEVVSADLEACDRDAPGAFMDCKVFFDKAFDGLAPDAAYVGKGPHLLSADAVGMWLCWNLLRRPPHEENERKLVRQLGGIAVSEFTRWWGPELT